MHVKTSDQTSLSLGFNGYTCNWGAHICVLYQSEAERNAVILGFLGQGLQDGDLCVLGKKDAWGCEIEERLAGRCPQCAAALGDARRFQAPSTRAIYYPDGVFSPWSMEERLNAFYTESQKDGPRNIRVAAEMDWALDIAPSLQSLLAYESRFNYFIQDKPWVGICFYDVNKFDGNTILHVLRTHPYTILNGAIVQNPYYQDPDAWLAQNAPEYLKKS